HSARRPVGATAELAASTWIPQLTAYFFCQAYMKTHFFGFEGHHLLGDSATCLIEKSRFKSL
ncbi:MAG: hypothetical protein K9K38_22680, partial [Rhodoferax sp.]|nr:hypothetical protein [Rhodoferax sp.]